MLVNGDVFAVLVFYDVSIFGCTPVCFLLYFLLLLLADLFCLCNCFSCYMYMLV
jgi:hypothetical protein